MYYWLKTHSKKIMAVLGAFLMVTFLIQQGPKTGGAVGRGSPVAYVGKLPIYREEKGTAEIDWKMLDRESFRMDILMERRQFVPPTEELGVSIVSEIRAHPELFLILAKEAESRGIVIGPEQDIVKSAI